MLSFIGSGWLGLVGLAAAWPQQPDTIPVPEVVRAAYEQGTRDRSGAPGERYWQIRPEYDLEARLDPERTTVYGSGTLSFVNRSDGPLQEIVLRLDQNRFRGGVSAPVSTRGIALRRLVIDGERIDLTGPAVTGLTTTVVRVRLARPVRPGQRLTLRAAWDYEVPLDERRLTLRQGRWGTDVFQIAQWYPRLAMYDDLGGWDVVPHDGSREFFNPFARFRVRLHVSSGWLVGATGALTNAEDVLGPTALRRLDAAAASDTTIMIIGAEERGEGVLTLSSAERIWTFEADSVSDFAWGASASYAWAVSSRTTATHRVLVHALMTPRHRDALLAGSAEAAEVIAALSGVVMPYAWRSHTLVDGPEGGMEYPGLTMSHGGIIAHELAHQWFPMMVGSDETRFDFMDEGFASFYAAVASGGPVARARAERPALVPLLVANDVRTARPVLGYGRGSRMLQTLAARVGPERLLAALGAYSVEWRFKHPSPWDFMASVERHLGEDLDAFWLEWLFSAAEIRPFELRDTASWSNMMYGGSSAVLYIEGAAVDTVDLLRGVQIVPGGILYQPVGDQGFRNVECGANEACVDLKPWVLRADSGVVPLADFVPGLDSILSSPLVLDGDLYYLAFEQMGSTYGVFARWFDPETGATRAVHIAEESLESDTPGRPLTPVRDGQCVLFRVHEDRFVFGPGLEACVRGGELPYGG